MLSNIIKLSMMRKKCNVDFTQMMRYFGHDEIFYEKGIYPYDYISGPSRLDETALPPKAAFYNSLTDEHIDDKQYARVHEMWGHLSMKTTLVTTWSSTF